ncbi:DUF378 domain-containing protein [Fuchsiella alkaliacetigena]|uniref:DUF378 domain-containing protein n=1 Tax=Fuchsiella alkaliacetigena TaxID=957042 RepID=UPI00200AFA56|nr:DUF378 domain-containing protein [Fuchsiella alkaliacetigena]MCK8823477.1 DUF378 domain-containing protein [Fuchsiella alkaliacetigena]
MNKLNKLALIPLIIIGLNWGLIGLFDYDLLTIIFGSRLFGGPTAFLSRIVYSLVGLSSLYLLLSFFTKVNMTLNED